MTIILCPDSAILETMILNTPHIKFNQVEVFQEFRPSWEFRSGANNMIVLCTQEP